MLQTPKESFLHSGQSAAFSKIVATEPFQMACDFALLQLQSEMAPTAIPGMATDPYIAIDANSQMWGARRVLAILCALPEPIKTPTPPKQHKLTYD